jgi:hypothetical protein
MNGVIDDRRTRRSFFGQATLVLAAPVTALAAEGPGDDVAARLAALEDANAIRELLHRYTQRVNDRLDAPPAPEVRSIALDSDPEIEVAADGTAAARALCTVTTATPIEGCGTLVEMARLQGDGVVRGTERRVLQGRLVKQHGVWQLDTAELRT